MGWSQRQHGTWSLRRKKGRTKQNSKRTHGSSVVAGVFVVDICSQHAGHDKLKDASLKGVYAVTAQERGDLKYSVTLGACSRRDEGLYANDCHPQRHWYGERKSKGWFQRQHGN